MGIAARAARESACRREGRERGSAALPALPTWAVRACPATSEPAAPRRVPPPSRSGCSFGGRPPRGLGGVVAGAFAGKACNTTVFEVPLCSHADIYEPAVRRNRLVFATSRYLWSGCGVGVRALPVHWAALFLTHDAPLVCRARDPGDRARRCSSELCTAGVASGQRRQLSMPHSIPTGHSV